MAMGHWKPVENLEEGNEVIYLYRYHTMLLPCRYNLSIRR